MGQIASMECRPDIIADDIADLLGPVEAMHEMVSEACSDHFGHVLVLLIA
jgi:hypothetical protein